MEKRIHGKNIHYEVPEPSLKKDFDEAIKTLEKMKKEEFGDLLEAARGKYEAKFELDDFNKTEFRILHGMRYELKLVD